MTAIYLWPVVTSRILKVMMDLAIQMQERKRERERERAWELSEKESAQNVVSASNNHFHHVWTAKARRDHSSPRTYTYHNGLNIKDPCRCNGL